MNTFLIELLGTIEPVKYLAWFVLYLIGSTVALLIRNLLTNLKSYSLDWSQILLNILICYIFIRFSLSVFHMEPKAEGALLLGLSGNELAIRILKKYLDKKEDNKV